MPIDAIDFKEDVSEGDVVTLLEDDGVQWIGTIVAIRNSSVKLLPLDDPTGTPVTILYESVKRYRPGRTNLTLKSGTTTTTSEAALTSSNTVVNSVAQNNAVQAKLDLLLERFKSSLERPLLDEVKPDFFRSQADSLSYTSKVDIEKEINKSKNIYDTAYNRKELARLNNAIGNLGKSITRYPREAVFYSLKGIFLFNLNKKDEAIEYLMIAAGLSNTNSDWLNLALLTPYYPLKALAFRNYFVVSSSVIENKYWYAFVNASCESSSFSSLSRLINKYIQNNKNSGQLELIANTIVFLFDKLGSKDDALAAIIELEKKSDLLSTVQKLYLTLQSLVEGRTEAALLEAEKKLNTLINSLPSAQTQPLSESLSTHASFHRMPGIGAGKFYSGYVTSFRKNSNDSKSFFWEGYIEIDGNKKVYYRYYDNYIPDKILHDCLSREDFTQPICFNMINNSFGQKQAINLCIKPINKLQNDANKDKLSQQKEFDLIKTPHTIERTGGTTLLARANSAIQAGDREQAVIRLSNGVKQFPDDERILLLLAQQLSALNKFSEASDIYSSLINVEKKLNRPKALKNAEIQYVLLSIKSGRIDTAKIKLKKLVEKYPNDEYLKQLNEKASTELIIDLNDESKLVWESLDELESDISPFLKRELESAGFYDRIISEKGDKPSPEDAKRLMAAAINSTANDQHPLFLEAAKAYSLLPPGSFDLDEYHLCLSRYAMQKAKVLVDRMLFLSTSATSIEKNAEILMQLRDSATSYYIEALSWLKPENVKDVGSSVINYFFKSLLIGFFAESPHNFSKDMLSTEFKKVFREALTSKNEELFYLACNAVLIWGSYPQIWNILVNIPDGPGAVTWLMMKGSFKNRVGEFFSKLTGQNIQNIQFMYPRDILRQAFEHRRKERGDMHAFCRNLLISRNLKSSEYFRELKYCLTKFPRANGSLFSSDIIMFERLNDIIQEMTPYKNASYEERGDMLVRTRLKLSNNKQNLGLLEHINQSPTYWQVVGCEAVIIQCLKTIETIEDKRMEDRKPKLSFSLEPASFTKSGTEFYTSLHTKNEGHATANNVKIELIVRNISQPHEPIYSYSFEIERIERNTDHTSSQITLPEDCFDESQGEIELFISAKYLEGLKEPQAFTIEKDLGNSFSSEEIPWNPQTVAKDEIFKGRLNLLSELKESLNRHGRSYTHMLWGVTRSGKTSILHSFRTKETGAPLPDDELNRTIVCIDWLFNKAELVNSPETLWTFLLEACRQDVEKFTNERNIDLNRVLKSSATAQAHDFISLVSYLKSAGLYPIFLIDEFSYIRSMFDKKLIDASFLSTMREMALNDQATFIAAGTYDVKELLTDHRYGITGQFVNLKLHFVTSIEPEPAKEIITIFEPKLRFTESAVNYIIQQSDCRPYLIQTIAYHCAQYALNRHRSILGRPEVEEVVLALAGLKPLEDFSALEWTHFQDNLIFFRAKQDDSTLDPSSRKQGAIYSAITTFISHEVSTTYNHLQTKWKEEKLPPDWLADGLKQLKDREVITEKIDEGVIMYSIKVGLFHLWWKRANNDVELEFDTLKV
ncbi:MAG: hypothetical protein LBT47_12325 [Deltaproteobacteria bacterium]|jgi:tetratricopeptide (TPR) repeat protein|nr:hypothetical protein [Deltaproteobacteria bacterium]